MKKILLLCGLGWYSFLFCAYIDNDLDGVDDSVDRCLDTPLSDLVDMSGCSVTSLLSLHHYDLLIGFEYANSDYRTLNQTDTLATTFQADYYYKNFSLQVVGSYFSTDNTTYKDDGFYDTLVSAVYRFETPLAVSLGVGSILPTYKNDLSNNKTDFFTTLNCDYTQDKWSFFGTYTYTFIGDDDYNENNLSISYKNTHTLSGGVGYYINNRLYSSLSYGWSQSIYEGITPITTLSLYGYYDISEEFFCTFSYTYGLSQSASDNYFGIRFGYYF